MLLLRTYEVAAGNPGSAVLARDFVTDLDLPLEAVFALVEHLSREGYLDYLGAGPRVALTSLGITYIESSRQRRQTLRE